MRGRIGGNRRPGLLLERSILGLRHANSSKAEGTSAAGFTLPQEVGLSFTTRPHHQLTLWEPSVKQCYVRGFGGSGLDTTRDAAGHTGVLREPKILPRLGTQSEGGAGAYPGSLLRPRPGVELASQRRLQSGASAAFKRKSPGNEGRQVRVLGSATQTGHSLRYSGDNSRALGQIAPRFAYGRPHGI